MSSTASSSSSAPALLYKDLTAFAQNLRSKKLPVNDALRTLIIHLAAIQHRASDGIRERMIMLAQKDRVTDVRTAYPQLNKQLNRVFPQIKVWAWQDDVATKLGQFDDLLLARICAKNAIRHYECVSIIQKGHERIDLLPSTPLSLSLDLRDVLQDILRDALQGEPKNAVWSAYRMTFTHKGKIWYRIAPDQKRFSKIIFHIKARYTDVRKVGSNWFAAAKIGEEPVPDQLKRLGLIRDGYQTSKS